MAERQRNDARIAAEARRQHGLVTGRQLAASHLSRSSIRRRVAAGSLVRAGRGVYGVGGAPRTWEQSALAAYLAFGGDAALSHGSAAAVWGLDVPREPAFHVTVGYGRSVRLRTAGVVAHRSRCWTPVDRVRRHGLPVTTPARTIVDLGAMLAGDQLARVVDEALCRRLVSPRGLLVAVDRLAVGRGRAARRVRTLVAPWGGAALESVAEAGALRAITAAGLPAPRIQHVVAGARARTDFAWPERMLVLEIDGFRWHSSPAAQARDSERANRLAAEGWTVLRATPAEMAQALPGVIAALRRHLGATPSSG